MNSWVHCNVCFYYYDNSDRFYLLNCTHIFCRDCLNKKVINNNSKCCLCNKSVKYKKIDNTLEPKLALALEADQFKHLADVTRNLEFGLRQVKHLHSGVKKIEQKMMAFKKMAQEMDEKSDKYKATIEKIKAQNKVLEQMCIDEKMKKMNPQRNLHNLGSNLGILSSSQNIRKTSTPSPLVINRSYNQYPGNRNSFVQAHGHPSITKLSSLRSGRVNF